MGKKTPSQKTILILFKDHVRRPRTLTMCSVVLRAEKGKRLFSVAHTSSSH
jgi:hypothetical protein